MSTSEELTNILSCMIAEQVSEQLKVIEDRYFAKSKQTLFTLQELADKWGCSKGHASRILKEHGVNPIRKRGKEHEYNGNRAEEAKAAHDEKTIDHEKLNWKMIAMQKKTTNLGGEGNEHYRSGFRIKKTGQRNHQRI